MNCNINPTGFNRITTHFTALTIALSLLFSAYAQQTSIPANNNKKNVSAPLTKLIKSPPKTKIKVLTLESTIVGNQEQPKIMTIVPWKKLEQKTVNTTLKPTKGHYFCACRG